MLTQIAALLFVFGTNGAAKLEIDHPQATEIQTSRALRSLSLAVSALKSDVAIDFSQRVANLPPSSALVDDLVAPWAALFAPHEGVREVPNVELMLSLFHDLVFPHEEVTRSAHTRRHFRQIGGEVADESFSDESRLFGAYHLGSYGMLLGRTLEGREVFTATTVEQLPLLHNGVNLADPLASVSRLEDLGEGYSVECMALGSGDGAPVTLELLEEESGFGARVVVDASTGLPIAVGTFRASIEVEENLILTFLEWSGQHTDDGRIWLRRVIRVNFGSPYTSIESIHVESCQFQDIVPVTPIVVDSQTALYDRRSDSLEVYAEISTWPSELIGVATRIAPGSAPVGPSIYNSQVEEAELPPLQEATQFDEEPTSGSWINVALLCLSLCAALLSLRVRRVQTRVAFIFVAILSCVPYVSDLGLGADVRAGELPSPRVHSVRNHALGEVDKGEVVSTRLEYDLPVTADEGTRLVTQVDCGCITASEPSFDPETGLYTIEFEFDSTREKAGPLARNYYVLLDEEIIVSGKLSAAIRPTLSARPSSIWLVDKGRRLVGRSFVSAPLVVQHLYVGEANPSALQVEIIERESSGHERDYLVEISATPEEFPDINSRGSIQLVAVSGGEPALIELSLRYDQSSQDQRRRSIVLREGAVIPGLGSAPKEGFRLEGTGARMEETEADTKASSFTVALAGGSSAPAAVVLKHRGDDGDWEDYADLLVVPRVELEE